MCGVPVVGRRRPLGFLAARADCVRTPPLQLQPCSPIRLVTGLRPPPRPRFSCRHFLYSNTAGSLREISVSLSVSMSMKRNVCLSFYTLHFARHCSVLSTRSWRLNEQVAVPTCMAAVPTFIPSWRRAGRLDV